MSLLKKHVDMVAENCKPSGLWYMFSSPRTWLWCFYVHLWCITPLTHLPCIDL